MPATGAAPGDAPSGRDACMTTDDRRGAARALTDAAERLDELADVAELMGDDATAGRFRGDAARCRDRAMALLD